MENSIQDFALNIYQKKAIDSAIYPRDYAVEGLYYCTLGLVGEGGEFANKFKKVLRDKNKKLTQDVIEDLILELGDVLWYVANIARELDTDLAEVATKNLKKLQSRKQSGTIQGAGDKR